MIKLLGLFGPKDGWSEADFLQHYKERHGAVFTGSPGFAGGFCTKYIQNLPVDGEEKIPFPTRPKGYAAASEIWFPSDEHMAALFATSDYQERIRPDEASFAAIDKADVVFCTERPIWSAPIEVEGNPDLIWARAPRIRLLVFRVPNPRHSAEELQEAWKTALDPMLEMPFFKANVRGYLQSVVRPGQVADHAQAAADRIAMVDEYYFDTVDAAVRFWTAALEDPALNAIWDQWTDQSRTQLFLARGHTVFE